MTIQEMIEVLQAAKRGEKIEVQTDPFSDCWQEWKGTVIHLDLNYRIAPKKAMSLVEELRHYGGIDSNDLWGRLCRNAADRIEELEKVTHRTWRFVDTDELMAEIARRVK